MNDFLSKLSLPILVHGDSSPPSLQKALLFESLNLGDYKDEVFISLQDNGYDVIELGIDSIGVNREYLSNHSINLDRINRATSVSKAWATLLGKL